MNKKLKLKIEIIPSSSWNNNLRSLLKDKMWREIAKDAYKRNNYKCFICSNKGRLEAHEVWQFDDENHVQKLVDVIPLCKKCHAVKHIGFAGIRDADSYKSLIKHFMKVNNCSLDDFNKHYSECLKKFEERSHFAWQLDLVSYKNSLKR